MRNLVATATEVAMLFYWLLAGALVLDLVTIDPSMMYSDYQNPLVVAWNWSFFPIDVAFAILGLTARYLTMSDELRFKLQTTASVLMFCAGLMAISFWIITGDFSFTWWVLNIWLIVLGLYSLFSSQIVSSKTK